MATITKYPNTVINDSNLEDHESSWSSLNNIKANDNVDAQCNVTNTVTSSGNRVDDPTTASTSGSGANWYNPGAAADGSTDYYADVYSGGGGWSRYLNLGGMTFDIPTTSGLEITSIKVDVVCNGQGYGRTIECQLLGSSTTSNAKTTTTPSSKGTVSFNYTNDSWGMPANRSEYSSLDVRLRIKSMGTNAGVYFVQVTAYYQVIKKGKANGVYATNFGFDLKDNAKINSVVLDWEEYIRNSDSGTSSVPTVPSRGITLLKANNGSNVTKTSSGNVPTSRTQKTLTFTRSSDIPNVKRANIEDSGFGVYFNPATNTASYSGKMYLDYVRLIVDYTDPTYSLTATLTSGVVVGNQVTYQLTLQNTNNCHEGVNIPVSISIPAGLSLASQSGNGTYSTGTGKWTAVLDSNKKAVLTLELNSTTSGNKTINASVDGFTTSISKTTTILPPTYTITSANVNESVTETHNLTYTITVNVNTSAISSVNVSVPVPQNMSYVSASGNGSYNSGTGIWNASFTNRTASMTFTWQGVTTSIVNQVISVGSVSFTKRITIFPANVTVPYSTEHDLPEDVLTYMEDGGIYTLSCWSVVNDTVLTYIYPGDKNFTISVINGENEYVSDKATEINTPSRISTTFIYNSNAPIKIRVYGQWLEVNPANANHEVGGFALYHIREDRENLLNRNDIDLNIATGSDYFGDTTGTSQQSGATVESSTEWAIEGEKSFKITFPGSVEQERIRFLTNENEMLPAVAGDERTLITNYTSISPFRLYLLGKKSDYTTLDSFVVNVPAAPSGGIISVNGIFSHPDTTGCTFMVAQLSQSEAVPNEIFVDKPIIKIGGLYPEILRTDYETPTSLFTNPDYLILDGFYSEITLEPLKGSGKYLFPNLNSNLNWSGFEEDEEIIIKGIEINGDIITAGEVIVNSTLVHGNEESNKSIVVPADNETFTLGGERDKWGLNQINLSDLTFIFYLTNIGASQLPVEVRNIAITIYYIYDETAGNPGYRLDGVHSREYHIFLSKGWEKPDGLNADLQSFKLNRRDGEIITSSTVTSKEFKIKFQIVANGLNDANQKLKEITAWMTNDRDQNQKPIPKAMIFDWDSDREYNVIMNDTVTPSFDIGEYECTTKFLVPEGVGWTQTKTTGNIGRSNSLIPVRPVLQVLCTGASEVYINESVTGQFLNIQHQFPAGTVLTIDTQKRTILDTDSNDYVTNISFDSYWFKIKTNYDFTGSNGCVIQKVTYKEAV
jgi:predicted phage tail component-like protein